MIEDSQILELYLKGEHNIAFNYIVRKYGERLYWHIRKMVVDHDTANDLLQNTYIKAWNALDTFREDSKLYTWLYRIATNETITHLNRCKLRSLLSLSDESKRLENKLINDPTFNGDKLQLLLQKAISKLPTKQRAVFCMRYYDEIPYDDMSEIMETSVGALKASYFHAHNKVVEYVKKNFELD